MNCLFFFRKKLYNNEKIENYENENMRKFYFLLTTHLQQYPLENVFSIIKQKNGYNRNSTCKTFINCFSSIFFYNIMKGL